MTFRIFSAFPSLAFISLFGQVVAQENAEGTVACDIGPVAKEFGGTEWNVFSCTKPDQVVIVAAPGNPAMPFYFVLYMEDGERKLHGQGTGSKEATTAAFEDLRVVVESEESIAALIAETEEADQKK